MAHVTDPKKFPLTARFIIITQGSVRSKEEWYGPPDPQPTGYNTTYHPNIETFETTAEVVAWVEKNASYKDPTPFRILQVDVVDVEIKTIVKLKMS